jgi:peptidoglycan-N-acetylglucosamine deacetylase
MSNIFRMESGKPMILKSKKIAIMGSIIFLLLIVFAGITYKIMNSRTFQFFGGIVNRVDTDKKVVALTFDDGPSYKTDTILSILKANDVKVTFFLIGSEVKKHLEESKKLILAGHEIGNHTYSHNRMVFKSFSYIKNEIEETDSLIKSMGYEDTIQFRPPNGKKLVLLPYYLKQHNRKTIMWDLEPNSVPEINSSSEKIVKYVVDNTKPGSIILLHAMNDDTGNTINSISGIIRGLKDKGFEFKTVNELIELSK